MSPTDPPDLARENQELREALAQLERESSLLRQTAEALVASVELQERLETLGPRFLQAAGAERVAVYLRTNDHLEPRVVTRPGRAAQRRLSRLVVNLAEATPGFRRVLAEGRPLCVIPAAESPDLPQSLRGALDCPGIVLAPLQFHGRLTGLVALGVEEPLADRQLQLVRALAFQAAAAVETGKAYEAERDVARILQESLLSQSVSVPGYQIASRYEPASAFAQVGGDYFDFIPLAPGRLGVVMGDVCGKGLDAAVYTAMAKYILRAYALEDSDPARVVERLNHALHLQLSEDCMFVTLIYGVLELDTGCFRYTNAAHPPALLLRSGGAVVDLPGTGGMVGALESMPFGAAEVQLVPGDTLVLFTDGVTEARSAGTMLETEGVVEVLKRQAGKTARQLADTIYARALDASGGRLRDDLAIVVLRALEGESSRPNG